MSGYAASARLRGGSTRFVVRDGSTRFIVLDSVRRVPRADPAGTAPTSPEVERVELAGRPLGRRLADRWEDLRDAWSQTTFYLFDPESWR